LLIDDSGLMIKKIENEIASLHSTIINQSTVTNPPIFNSSSRWPMDDGRSTMDDGRWTI